MPVEYSMQYIGVAIFITVLIILLFKRRDVKKYIPVGLFAIVYANLWCYFAEYTKLWSFPMRLFPKITIVPIAFNYFILPVMIILWLKYCPGTLKGKIIWALAWSLLIIGVEFAVTRYTKFLDYTNGFDIHISFVLWLISWFIFYRFHHWISSE